MNVKVKRGAGVIEKGRTVRSVTEKRFQWVEHKLNKEEYGT